MKTLQSCLAIMTLDVDSDKKAAFVPLPEPAKWCTLPAWECPGPNSKYSPQSVERGNNLVDQQSVSFIGELIWPVILSEPRVPVLRDEGESKDPENVCATMLMQGVLPRDCPGTGVSLVQYFRKVIAHNR